MRIFRNIKYRRFISPYFTLVFMLSAFGFIVMPTDIFSKIFNFKYIRYPLSVPEQHDHVTEKIKHVKEPTWDVKSESSMPRNTNYSTQFDTLKGIQDFIWNRLNDLQYYGHCENKQILYCESTHPYAGFGSMLFRYGACLQLSFALGRTIFLKQQQYQHFGGLNKWMKLESKRCGYLKEKYRNYANKCNLNDRKCYLDGNVLEVNNSYKVLEIDMKDAFPIPRYIPTTIPSFIKQALKKLKIRQPWLWFSSQFLGYLVLRPNDEFQKTLENVKSAISYNGVALSLHIRRGDKIAEHEAEFIPDEKFADAVQSAYRFKKVQEINSVRTVYIASDDRLSNMREVLPPNYVMKRLPQNYLSEGLQSYFAPNFSSIVLESIIIDINLLSHTDITICTMSSNICRLAYLLKNAIPPHNATNRVISLDWQGYFERYWWAGYDVPLKDFYLTINKKTNISLDFNGTKILLNYEKGYLYQIIRPNLKIRYGNNSYLYKMRPIHQSGIDICYIVFEDLIEWPGNPEYPVFLQ